MSNGTFIALMYISGFIVMAITPWYFGSGHAVTWSQFGWSCGLIAAGICDIKIANSR